MQPRRAADIARRRGEWHARGLGRGDCAGRRPRKAPRRSAAPPGRLRRRARPQRRAVRARRVLARAHAREHLAAAELNRAGLRETRHKRPCESAAPFVCGGGDRPSSAPSSHPQTCYCTFSTARPTAWQCLASMRRPIACCMARRMHDLTLAHGPPHPAHSSGGCRCRAALRPACGTA